MNDRETRCYSGEVRAEQYDNARPTFWGMARYLTVVQNLCGDFVKSSSRGLLMMY
ncbi:head maturation protease [Escherichia phage vB_EcoS-640R1]|nr:hypothetical protein AZ030_001220 [Escherichia coli]URC09887.1 head maturation protease [Escherichia phage vB_EcoS-733R4]URC10071.1 head maturation protease [Escherichia phage vB_EcoS-640R1]URC10516.1 head maturation protease [Escherichia phage vB_EcoS-716R1]